MRSANLLKLYMFNYKENIWQKVDYVLYDAYNKPNSKTFSYVIDRNIVNFEKYFLKTQENEFECKFIFVIDESFGNCFSSSLNFAINSVNSRIYYSSTSTEYYLNPEIIFDIDLTKYYKNFELCLDQIELSLII